MTEQWLYGVKVKSVLPLLEHDPECGAVVSGQHQSLTVSELDQHHRWPDDLLRFPFYKSHDRQLIVYTDCDPGRSRAGQPWCLEVEGVVSFWFRGGEGDVYYSLQREGSERLASFWFVHIFLPLYLTVERGFDFMHASAVDVEGNPLFFLAPSMGGKSTLGAYFVSRGHALIADDKVATMQFQRQFFAIPSHRYHRPFRQNEVLGSAVENFSTVARPLHKIYILEKSREGAQIDITELAGFLKFEALMPHYLFAFPFLQEQRLAWLANLSAQVGVYRVCRPWGLESLERTYNAVCRHSSGK